MIRIVRCSKEKQTVVLAIEVPGQASRIVNAKLFRLRLAVGGGFKEGVFTGPPRWCAVKMNDGAVQQEKIPQTFVLSGAAIKAAVAPPVTPL